MKLLLRHSFLLAVLFLFMKELKAQDIHLSQYNASPMNLNPAYTGLFDGDFRFTGNYRSQWASVSTPYKTTSGAFDMRIAGNRGSRGMLCGGLLINSDKAGSSQLGLTQLSGALSFTIKADEESRHHFTFGLMGSMAQRSISYDKLVFDEQYNGDAYDPNLPSGEAFANNGYSYSDFSGGMNWNFNPSSDFTSNIGVSSYHLFEPDMQTFKNANGLRLSRKWNLHGNMRFPIGGKTDLIPSLMWEHQHANDEVVYGSNIRFGFEPHRGFSNALFFGLHYRHKDAFACIAGMEYSNVTVGLSYDVNASGLKPASRYRGGFELSVIYIFKKVAPLKGPKKPCPVYL